MMRRPEGKGMAEVAALLQEGARTLAESQRAQDHSRRLEVETRELILTYRAHRVRPISGGSLEVPTPDGPEPDDVFTRTCDICGREILPDAHEYEIVFSALTFVLDRDCFGLWQDEVRAAGGQTTR